jgi:acylphosphatase
MRHERRRFVFSGSVQGVGFRATARQMAQRFQVAGFVRNLPDGRVELITEGEPGAVATFIEEIRRVFGDLIQAVAEEIEPAGGEPLEGFTIRF